MDRVQLVFCNAMALCAIMDRVVTWSTIDLS